MTASRIWFSRDTGLTADPQVQLLGVEHGPGGPLVLEEMLALAKLRDNGGSFTTTYKALAHRAFVTPGKTKLIVAMAASAADGDEPIIELVEQGSKDFTARFLKWSRWQKKDPTGAKRKKALRERDAERERTSDVT